MTNKEKIKLTKKLLKVVRKDFHRCKVYHPLCGGCIGTMPGDHLRWYKELLERCIEEDLKVDKHVKALSRNK